MAKLMNILAASVGGGIVLGASIRIGEALANGTAKRYPDHGIRLVPPRNGYRPDAYDYSAPYEGNGRPAAPEEFDPAPRKTDYVADFGANGQQGERTVPNAWPVAPGVRGPAMADGYETDRQQSKSGMENLLLARLEQMEAKLGQVAASAEAAEAAAAAAAATAATQVSYTPEPLAPAPPAEWQEMLTGMVDRIERQQGDLEAIRDQVASATRTVVSAGDIASSLRGELGRQIGDDLDRRLTQVEAKLHESMEAALSETVDAMVNSIETRVAPRITRLEKDVAGQNSALAELRDCSVQSDRSIQRLVAVMERVMLPQAGLAPPPPMPPQRRPGETTFDRRAGDPGYDKRRAPDLTYVSRGPNPQRRKGEPAYEPRRAPELTFAQKRTVETVPGPRPAPPAPAPVPAAEQPKPAAEAAAASAEEPMRSVLGGRLPAEIGVNGPTARRPALYVESNSVPVTRI